MGLGTVQASSSDTKSVAGSIVLQSANRIRMVYEGQRTQWPNLGVKVGLSWQEQQTPTMARGLSCKGQVQDSCSRAAYEIQEAKPIRIYGTKWLVVH